MTPDEARKAAEELVSTWGNTWVGKTFVPAVTLGRLDYMITAALHSAYEQGVADGKAENVEAQEP